MTAAHARLVDVPVLGTEALGAYALVRLDASSFPPPAPGRFAMATAAERGAAPPRPVGLFTLPSGDVGILVDPDYGGDLARASALRLLGPLGRGYDLTGLDASTTLLVAGGIGLTVLVDVPRLLGGGARLLAGFRTGVQAEAVRLLDADATVVLAPATVTEPLEAALDPARVRAVLAAGPLPMMQAVAAACAARSVTCQVALEARMACGFGACYGCAVELDGTWQRLCIEGPVVDAARLS